MVIRIPDLPASATLDDVIMQVNYLQGAYNGYSPFGAPSRLYRYDGLDDAGDVATDYANIVGVNEDTLGLAWQSVYGDPDSPTVIVSADKNGLHGPLPWETTSTLTVGSTSWLKGNVGILTAPSTDPLTVNGKTKTTNLWVTAKAGVGSDIGTETLLVTGTQGITSKLAVGNATVGTENLVVTGTGQVTTRLGVGGAPDSSVGLKVTSEAWITSKLGVGATVGSENLLVTGTAQVTQRLGVGGAPDGSIAFKVTGAATITTDLVVDTTTLVVDSTNNFVGIGTAAPITTLHVSSGPIIVSGTATETPASGEGIGLFWNAATNTGTILPFDYTGAAFGTLVANALSIDLRASSTTRISVNGTGIGFFAATPVAKPTVSGSRGGNAALADLLTELATLGLITDSSSA